jgi:hypothetical protein
MARLNRMFIALVVFSCSVVSSAYDSGQQRNVFDYYLKVPPQYLPFLAIDSKEARKSAVWIKDLENGYLQARQQGEEIYAALKLFRNPEGSDLIAIETRNCVRGCFSNLTFLTNKGDQWGDVTGEMLPVIEDKMIRETIAKQVEMRPTFQSRLLYTLPRGGSAIEVSEHWSGITLGEIEWLNGKFGFKPLKPDEVVNSYTVLASTSNPAGDRLQIIGINPQLPAKLPLKGFLQVKIAYELKSARACAVWARPIVTGQRLPDNFHGGSMFHTARTGVMTTFLGFNNEAHADQIRVAMADENLNEILTLFYNVDASWEGSLECPSFRVSCFSNSKDSGIPISCMVYPSGLRPDHRLTYNWTLSNGVITSGQGTTTIRIDTAGEENVTAMVQVIGLGPKCDTRASFRSTPAIISRPSK